MKQVKIGSQVWAKENLKVTNFRNGEPIPVVQDQNEWSKMSTAAMCFTPEGEALYNWYAVNDPRGLAPEGWHIPSDAEWTELADFLGGDVVAGFKMKYVNPVWNGTNESGFSALPGGYRFHYNGNFSNVGYYGYWWSSSPHGSDYAWVRILYSDNGLVYRYYFYRRYGLSVRCVRDEKNLTLEQRVEALENKVNKLNTKEK